MMGHTVVHFNPFYITMKTPYIPIGVIVVFLVVGFISNKIRRNSVKNKLLKIIPKVIISGKTMIK